MSSIGSSKIGEMYVGSTKIAQAYVGSTLVFQLPATGYDSYKVHLTWSSNDNFNMAGMKINDALASPSQVTSLWYYNGGWQEASSTDKNTAIEWYNNDNGKSFYGTAIDINFTADSVPTSVQIKTGTWYGGGSMKVTMHVAGVKNGVETDLGYTQHTNSASLTYTVNIT
jgi:hypothetical protein